MTREEMIKALNEIKECPIGLKAWYVVALEMAIKALEQNESAEEWYKLFVKKLDEQEPITTTNNDEPITIIYPTIVCEDAISREAVIEWLKDKDIIKLKSQEENARKELRSLPSVTPKPTECEDAISRKAVIYYIKGHIHEIITESGTDKNAHTNSILRALINGVETMPSVTHKSGKWLNKDDFIYALKTCGFSVHHGQVMYAEDDLIQRFDEMAESEEQTE